MASTPATWLSGYIPDLPTPFDADGAVDLRAFQRLCERQIEAVSPLVAALSRDATPALKAAMSGLGLMRPDPRLPLVAPESAVLHEIALAVATVAEHDMAAAG